MGIVASSLEESELPDSVVPSPHAEVKEDIGLPPRNPVAQKRDTQGRAVAAWKASSVSLPPSDLVGKTFFDPVHALEQHIQYKRSNKSAYFFTFSALHQHLSQKSRLVSGSDESLESNYDSAALPTPDPCPATANLPVVPVAGYLAPVAEACTRSASLDDLLSVGSVDSSAIISCDTSLNGDMLPAIPFSPVPSPCGSPSRPGMTFARTPCERISCSSQSSPFYGQRSPFDGQHSFTETQRSLGASFDAIGERTNEERAPPQHSTPPTSHPECAELCPAFDDIAAALELYG